MAKKSSFESTQPKVSPEAQAVAAAPSEKKKIEPYEVQNAMRVLMEAEAIKENTKLMAEVKRSMKKTFSSIRELRDASNAMHEVEESDSEESEEEAD